MLAIAVVGTLSANSSVYTPLGPKCRAVPMETASAFKARGVDAQSCPALAGWQLYVVRTDTNTWIEIRSGELKWSSEDAIVYDSPIGEFPRVRAENRLEWRLDANDRPVALIFRVTAQRASSMEEITRLFVVRLEPARACLLGRVTTNVLARSLADGLARCTM